MVIRSAGALYLELAANRGFGATSVIKAVTKVLTQGPLVAILSRLNRREGIYAFLRIFLPPLDRMVS